MTITEIITLYPRISIICFSIVITLISTLVTMWLTNQEHLRELKKRQKEIQKELRTLKPGDGKYKELQSEVLQITGTMMKSSFKPLLITMIPFLILFYWIRSIYTPIMGFGWFWYYLGASIVASTIFRKLFKMA